MAEDMEIRPSPPKTPEPPAPIVGGKEGGKEAQGFFKETPISGKLVKENPQAAQILRQIAEASADDYTNPEWLLRRGLDLRKTATPETQLELHSHLQRILGEINRTWDDQPQKLQDLKAHLDEIAEEFNVDLSKLKQEFNRQRLGDVLLEKLGQLPPTPGEAKWFYDPDVDQITEPVVQEIIEKFTRRLEDRPEIAGDHHRLNEFYRDLEEEIERELKADRGRKKPRIRDESKYREESKRFKDKVLNEKLGPLEEEMRRQREAEETGKAYLERHRRQAEAAGLVIHKAEVNAEGEEDFEFSSRFPKEDIKFLKMGFEGEKTFFNRFIQKEEMKVRDPVHIDLPDIYRLDEFWDYLTWKYGPEEGLRWKIIWEEELTTRKELHFAMVELFYKVEQPKYILSSLGRIRPKDLEFITKTELTEYTIPMVEEEIKIMLGEKLARWKEADRTKETRLKRIQEIEEGLRGGQIRADDQAIHRELGRLREEQMIWDQGVWLTDADLQGNFEIFKRAMEKKAIGQELTPEEEEWAKREYASNLEWRVRKKLEDFLGKKGEKFEDWEINKALSLGMKFNIVTLRMPMLLAYWYIEPKTGKTVMQSPPFEDLVRILNPESYYFRFGMGGKLGEVTRSIHQSAVLGERAKGAGIFLTKLPEWNDPSWREGLKPHELKIVEENRHRLWQIERQMGVPWSELIRGGVTNIGGLFDATFWRGEIGIWDEIIRAYSQMGKDHREFALGFQMGLAGGEAAYEAEGWAINEADRKGLTGRKREMAIQDFKKKRAEELKKEKKLEIVEKIIRREPLLLAQLMANDKIELVEKYKDRVDWQKLEQALQFTQMEMTTQRLTEVELRDGKKISIDFGNKDFFREVCGKYLKLEAGENIEHYHSFIKDLQERAEAKKNKLASYQFPMTLSLTSIPWKDSSWISLGMIAFERRLARDVAAAIGARDATFKLWMNPSPLKWEEIAETIMEGRKSINDYADINTAEEWAKSSTQNSIAFNENKLRRLINWFPGLETGFRNLDGIFGTLRKLGIKGADAETAKRMLESFSYSVLFYGPNGNAWNEDDITVCVNFLRSIGAFTENPQFAQEILQWAKADFPWRMYGFAQKVWFPAVVMILTMMLSQLKEEKE